MADSTSPGASRLVTGAAVVTAVDGGFTAGDGTAVAARDGCTIVAAVGIAAIRSGFERVELTTSPITPTNATSAAASKIFRTGFRGARSERAGTSST